MTLFLPSIARGRLTAAMGAGGVIGPRLLRSLRLHRYSLIAKFDGTFPNYHPDPGSQTTSVDLLIARVKSEQADIGIAFDGDADRLGASHAEQR